MSTTNNISQFSLQEGSGLFAKVSVNETGRHIEIQYKGDVIVDMTIPLGKSEFTKDRFSITKKGHPKICLTGGQFIQFDKNSGRITYPRQEAGYHNLAWEKKETLRKETEAVAKAKKKAEKAEKV